MEFTIKPVLIFAVNEMEFCNYIESSQHQGALYEIGPIEIVYSNTKYLVHFC